MAEHGSFIWDRDKELLNITKHRIDFVTATKVFSDPKRKIIDDSKHNEIEQRYFCLGKIENRVITVRFLYRGTKIRIIGAGYWRKGEKIYDQGEKEATN